MISDSNLRAIERYKRYDRDYIKVSYIILAGLEMFASENPQEEFWYNNFFDVALITDWILDFDSETELLAPDIRKNLLPDINCTQFRELLRCNRYYWDVVMRATDDASSGLKLPDDSKEAKRRLVTHPLWLKMSEQSRKTLRLLRRNPEGGD